MMCLNCLISKYMKCILASLLVVLLVVSCGVMPREEDKKQVTVSIPAVAYFVERMSPELLEVNVMIPQSVGHTDYVLRPSQLAQLSHSSSYLALGNLDFEITWREKIFSVAKEIKWVDLSRGIDLIEGGCSHGEHHHAEHHHASDPHYWLSPKQAMLLTNNIAVSLKEILPNHVESIDSAKLVLLKEIESWHNKFDSISSSSVASGGVRRAFMIYHPSLSYLARDYGFSQYEIEKDGKEPTPKSLIEEIEKSVVDSVNIVFVQQGYDIQKASVAAQQIGAQVIEIAPEGYDWDTTMSTIYKALKR